MKFLVSTNLIAAFLVLAGLGGGLSSARAASLEKRSITLEFEEVADSSGYEIEVRRVLVGGEKKKAAIFKTKKATWTAKILTGRYEMRLRSFDDRGVAGDWSEPSEFWVRIPAPKLVSPATKSNLKTDQAETQEVKFSWQPVTGAEGYRLEVFNNEGKIVQTKDVPALEASVVLGVAQNYKWRVTSLMQENEPGEVSKDQFELTLIGQKLAQPRPEKPDTKFVTELKWTVPDYTKNIAYAIQRRTKDGKWLVVDKKSIGPENSIKLDPKAAGGNHRLMVKALAPLREASETASVDFYVYEGSRTPAAIEQAMLKEAIEKEYNHYFIGSYLLSNLLYEGNNKEAKGVKFDVLSGTGRLGYGYMPKGKWGAVAIADMGGVIINNKNYLFGSIEGQAVYKKYLMSVTQVRFYGGLFVKQTPEAKGLTKDDVTVFNITHSGPHGGAQLWHPFTYRFGVQLNAQVYYSAMGWETPNGLDLVPTLSYQAGVMGSYKFREHITGFGGYAYRLDRVAYKARPYDGSSSEPNFANPGDVNELTYTGHYLNLYLEYGF